MTSPRSYDGVGYYPPSFSSGTPIYDSLVAERGVPQIAPINVPPALPPASSYGSSYSSSYGSGFDSPAPVSNLPALPPARLALGPGPSAGPATTHIPVQPGAVGYAAAPQMPNPGYVGAPQPYVPGQRPPAPMQGGFQQQPGYPTPQPTPAQNSFSSAPQGFSGPSFGAQGFHQSPPQQGFDQISGGNQLRPAAPVAPVRPPQPYPAQAPYPQYQQYPHG